MYFSVASISGEKKEYRLPLGRENTGRKSLVQMCGGKEVTQALMKGSEGTRDKADFKQAK